MFPDETYLRTFNKPGNFPYRCGPHPEMTGIVTVEQ
ncbi:MAG: plastocyanin/azurin family copper-binding protein [Sedimenticola sp.]